MNIRVTLITIKVTGKTIAIAIESNETVEKLRSKIDEKEGICPLSQGLIYNGKTLSEGLLSDYGIANESIINLVFRLPGGFFSTCQY